MTTPNDPAYENQPQHWNQPHAFTINATGSEISNAFSNANGLSFGLSAGALTGSYTVPSVPSVTEYFSRTNTTFNGANISGSITNNTNGFQLSLSVAPGGGGADGYNILAAGTQTANTTGTILFVDSNGISFGMSNNSRITASYTVPVQSNQTGGIYHVGNTTGQSSSSTYDVRTLSIDGAGIVSAGWSNGTVRISATQSNQAWSGSNASSTFQTLVFNNANGVSWSNNAGSVQASYSRNVASNAIQAVGSETGSGTNTSRFAADDHVHAGVFSLGVSTAGNTIGDTRVDVGRFVFQGGNNITLSQVTAANALNTIIVSAGAGGGGETRVSAYAVSNTTQSTSGTIPLSLLSFQGNGIVSAGISNGSVVISATQSNQAVSNSAGSFTFHTLNFSNANNVTWGTSAGGIITASVAAPGAAAENNWVNLLGANTDGNTTASGSTIGYSGINLTLSGTNGSVVNISAPATSSLVGTNGISISTNGSTISISNAQYTFPGYNHYADLELLTIATSQGTLSIEPMQIPNIQFDRVQWLVSNVNSSNSSGSHTLSFRIGIYTQNVSTLSLLTSQSTSYAVTHSGTAGSYSLYSGIRLMSMGLTTTLTEGNYWLAFNSNTTSGGANGSYSMFGVSNMASNFLGHWGSSHATTYQLTLGQGLYTASTTGIPGSIGFSQIRGSDSQALRSPAVMFASSTV